MKLASTLAMTTLFLVAATPAHATPLAEAQKRLEAARENLEKAVKRIEKDPPSTQDLDAAHAAVGALKDALDAGAAHEPKDLGYARAALAARKQLRVQGEYVDERRAKVHIHNHRRSIDAALAKVKEPMDRVLGKAPSQADFDAARQAAEGVKKAVAEGRAFASQDDGFAKYLADTEAAVARHLKAIDDRWVQLSADQHRGVVTQARETLAKSMAALNERSTDADFEAANRAVVDLSARLDEGKPLEAQVAAYRADAERGRKEVAQARQRMEQLLNDAVLARLKSEIEPAHKDLLTAARALRRKPTEDELAEARTAAIVVRKLVEKFQPQASLSKPFGQYVNEVKSSLVEVEVELQRRILDAARIDLARAMRDVERRTATDAHFAEANTALTVLVKTLETVHQREPALLKTVADSRELIRHANLMIPKRRLEVDVQRLRERVQEAKRTAEGAVREIQQPNPGTERLEAAEASLRSVEALLNEGAELMKKDREFSQYARDTRQRMTELSQRIAARKIALAAQDARTLLTEAVAEAKAKLEVAGRPDSADADLEAASKSVDALTQAIETRGELETQDRGYAVAAERAREQLGRLMETLDRATQVREVRRLTVDALAAGTTAVTAAGRTDDRRKQKAQYEEAIARFKTCESEGAERVKHDAALASVTVLAGGTPSTPTAVIALCGDRRKTAEQQLRDVNATVGFEDGPKRSWELASQLIAKKKGGEALPHVENCIASGLIHQNEYPELKTQKFQVAGGSLTLPELIAKCVEARKRLVDQQ